MCTGTCMHQEQTNKRQKNKKITAVENMVKIICFHPVHAVIAERTSCCQSFGTRIPPGKRGVLEPPTYFKFCRNWYSFVCTGCNAWASGKANFSRANIACLCVALYVFVSILHVSFSISQAQQKPRYTCLVGRVESDAPLHRTRTRLGATRANPMFAVFSSNALHSTEVAAN
jgi:hypothetical protein